MSKRATTAKSRASGRPIDIRVNQKLCRPYHFPEHGRSTSPIVEPLMECVAVFDWELVSVNRRRDENLLM